MGHNEVGPGFPSGVVEVRGRSHDLRNVPAWMPSGVDDLEVSDESLFGAMRAGACGYLLKGSRGEEIERGIRPVATGELVFGPGVAERVKSLYDHAAPVAVNGPPMCCLMGPGTLAVVDLSALIDVRPGVRGGKPCFIGTRIAVYDVLEYLASGMAHDEIIGDFPELTEAHIRAALAFAALREHRLAAPA